MSSACDKCGSSFEPLQEAMQPISFRGSFRRKMVLCHNCFLAAVRREGRIKFAFILSLGILNFVLGVMLLVLTAEWFKAGGLMLVGIFIGAGAVMVHRLEQQLLAPLEPPSPKK